MQTRTVSYDAVRVGDLLPERVIDVTTTLIVGGAIATRDFTPVHHDRAAAQAQGMQDVFMNILTTQGLVGTFVGNWAGPKATVREVGIRLGTPNFPGAVMRITGRIRAKHDDDATVEIEILGTNATGTHVTGSARVTLPR
jgi:acyl dehydratase